MKWFFMFIFTLSDFLILQYSLPVIEDHTWLYFSFDLCEIDAQIFKECEFDKFIKKGSTLLYVSLGHFQSL